MPSAKYQLKPQSKRDQFKQAALGQSDIHWTEKPEQYCDYRLDGKTSAGWVRIKQYQNGTLYLESSTDDGLALLTQLLSDKPVTSKKAAASADKPDGKLDITGLHVGSDESGKGDYFGPLVIAGVLVNDKTAGILETLGVQDSKALTDKHMGGLSQDIIATVGEEAHAVVSISPKRYNEMYASFKSQGKNLNDLLAWGHATVIDTLLKNNPDCSVAIVDKFANERVVQNQLKSKGLQDVKLHQVPRAEANVAVAAASILARNQFVNRLEALSHQFNVDLPLGAGPKVTQQGRVFVNTHGKDKLNAVAKLHFKTTQGL